MEKIFNQKGVTAIEVLIGIGLVAVIVTSIYSSLMGAMNNINESRKRTGALALANEKMEIIRNLPYNQIGTIEGIVPGPLYQMEQVVRNNYEYSIETEVRYIDDPTDGEFPDDLINNDYKQVHIKVDWGDSKKSASLYSIFVPNGLESNIGAGTLSINVMDSTSNPVSAVSVRIQSLDDNPTVNYSTSTDALGNLFLPGVSKQHYRIFLSKDDYEDIQTYPNPPDGGFTPIDADINVIESFLNTKTFFMDKSANLTLEAINIITNEGIEDIDFDLKGGKKIGINPETFNVKRTESTDSSGHAVFSNISPGSYSIENINSLDTSEYAFIGTDELIPFEISSEENHVVEFIFTNKNENSLVVLVKDQTTKETLSEASVKLTGGEFDQTVLTGETGIAFFPQSPDVLISGDYDLLVSIDGYSDYDESVEINDLVKKEVELAE